MDAIIPSTLVAALLALLVIWIVVKRYRRPSGPNPAATRGPGTETGTELVSTQAVNERGTQPAVARSTP